MEEKRYSTFEYAKLFLLMIIPIYGFCYTALLAFNSENDEETKCLARGALIARFVFWMVIVVLIWLGIYAIWPTLSEYIGNFEGLKYISKMF